jgi:hypothetical protein
MPARSAFSPGPEVAAIRALTDRPFGVNLFVLDPAAPDETVVRRALDAIDPLRADAGLPPGQPLARYAPDFRAQLDALIELRVPVVSFTFGVLSKEDIARLKAAGSYVIGTATHVAEGIAWRDAGADAIAAQGAEAGAHRGTFIGSFEDALVGTMALVPQLVDATGLPVLAAGGVMDGRGIVAALALGAQGVQMGTAFLTCAESAIPADWKARVHAMSDNVDFGDARDHRTSCAWHTQSTNDAPHGASQRRCPVSGPECIDPGIASDGGPREQRRLSVAVGRAGCAAWTASSRRIDGRGTGRSTTRRVARRNGENRRFRGMIAAVSSQRHAYSNH